MNLICDKCINCLVSGEKPYKNNEPFIVCSKYHNGTKESPNSICGEDLNIVSYHCPNFEPNIEQKWYKCVDGKPDDIYLKYQLDWVLVQFEESDTGFRGIPMMAEWNKVLNKWNFEDDYMNEVDYYQKLKAVAYMPIQRYEEEN